VTPVKLNLNPQTELLPESQAVRTAGGGAGAFDEPNAEPRPFVALLRKCQILKPHWKLIAAAALAAMTMAALYQIFIATKRFQAYAVIMPATTGQSVLSESATVGEPARAAFEPSARSAGRYVAVMNSYDFTMALVTPLHLDTRLIARDGTDPSKLTPWRIYQQINQRFSSRYDYDSGELTLYYVDSDPALAGEILSGYIEELRERVQREHMRSSSAAVISLREEVSHSRDPLIQAQLYELMAHQIEHQALAPLRAEFALRVVQPPVVPDKWYSADIALSILWAGLSIVLALCSYFLIRERQPRHPRTHEGPNADRFYAIVALPAVRASLGRRILHVAAFGVGLLALNVLGPGKLKGEEAILASAILAVCAIPVFSWLWGLERNIPLMPFICMTYAMEFPLSLFFVPDNIAGYAARPSDLISALSLVLAGLACALLGYYGPQRRLLARLTPRFDLRWPNLQWAKIWGHVFSVTGLAIFVADHAIHFPLALRQFVVFGSELCILGICILFGLQILGSLDKLSKIALWCGFAPARVLLGLGTGLVSEGGLVIMALAFCYAVFARSIPWKTLLVTVLAALIIRPLMSPFRTMTWHGPMKNAPLSQKAVIFADLASNLLRASGVRYDYLAEITLARFSNARDFGEVIHDTPGIVPYWKGATFYPLLFKPIPRPLWPGKPSENTGQDFGHRYGFLSPDNGETSFNLAQLIELYVNFGVIGVLLGMFLYGAIYRASIDMFVHPGMGFGGAIAAVYLSTHYLSVGTAANIVFGGAMWAVVFIALVHLLVTSSGLAAVDQAVA
jgi:Chain length determinant protein